MFRRGLLVAGLVAVAALVWWMVAPRGTAERAAAKPVLTNKSVPSSSARSAEPPPPLVGAPLQLNRASSGRDRPASAGSFEGKVVSSSTGKGVPGAEITFEHESGAFSVRANAEGSFAFHPTKLGQYRLAAILAGDYLPFAPEWGRSPVMVTARAGERIRDIVLFLTPAIEYLGVVRNPKNELVAGAQISLLDASQGEMALAPLPDSFVSNERGEFTFRAPAWAWLEATHPSFSAGRGRVDASVQASRRLELRLSEKDEDEPDATGSLGGQVVDPKGAPISGAAIQARRRGPRWGSRFSSTSGPDGRFEVQGLAPEGRYDLVATYPGFASARAEAIRAGTTNVMLRLAAGARLRGVVRDVQSSSPVVAFNISVLRARGALERDSVASQAFMDGQGQYEISGLPPGAYAAVASGYGYAPSREKRFSISDALGEATIDFELERGGELVGTVVDRESGAPLIGAQVQMEGQLGPESSIPLLTSAITDASGEFKLGGLASGIGSVVASAEGHHSRIIAGLRFENGSRLGPLRIDLKPTGEGETPIVELEGIGATLMVRRDSIFVGGVMAGGGAAQAGLSEGDEILSVDGQPVTELGFRGAIQNIRGPEGSCVPLGVRRAHSQQISEINVCRRRIQGS